jgi:hypothetical protein
MLTILRKLDWKYVISETVIVAIGVAMALMAGAWWQDRTDRGTELAYLQNLREEFTVTALDLNEEIELSVESMVAIDELLELMTSGRLEAPSEVLKRTAKAFETSVLRPVTATYNDLVTSGNFGILRSDPLRIALAEWSAHLVIHRRLEDHILFPHYLATDDFLMRNMTVSEVLQADRIPKAPFEMDVSELLSDRAFWNLLVIRRSWIQNRRVSLEELQHRLGLVILLLGVQEQPHQ